MKLELINNNLLIHLKYKCKTHNEVLETMKYIITIPIGMY